MNEQSRINAMIAYFFLGPLFLMVSKDTPLGEAYVQGHAKRASSIMGITLIAMSIYFFLLKPLLDFQLFSISLHSVILTVMMIVLSTILLHGAYRAYHGIDARTIRTITLNITNEYVPGSYSEEEKIRILASFIPFVGVFIAKKYPIEPYIIGQKVGGALSFLFITLIVFYGGSVSSLIFGLTILAIVIFIVTAVYLFLHGEFLSLGIYKYIPTYTSIEAHISASTLSIYEFFRVAFGGVKRSNYRDIYNEKFALYSEVHTPTKPYILPSWIIGIPILNLITVPSLTLLPMREYRPMILQGILMTLILILILWVYGFQSSMTLYILFPAVALIADNGQNIHIRAPITSWIMSINTLLTQGHQKVQALGEKKEEVSFKYEKE